eukprot:g23147.t1
MAARKTIKAQNCAQRIEVATTSRSQVVISDLAAADAENLFALYDFDGISLLPRGSLTEVLRDVGLEKELGDDFAAFSKLAFDSHSAEAKQNYAKRLFL